MFFVPYFLLLQLHSSFLWHFIFFMFICIFIFLFLDFFKISGKVKVYGYAICYIVVLLYYIVISGWARMLLHGNVMFAKCCCSFVYAVVMVYVFINDTDHINHICVIKKALW